VVLTGSSATDLATAIGTLLGRRGDAANPDRVLHHRSKSGTEIDFVGGALGGCAIESKYVDARWKRATRTLTDSPWRCIVATRSVLDLEDPDLLAVPAAILAWLIDN